MSRSKTTIFVPVPSECMGYVIGKRGKNIIQIQEQTQAKIESRNGSNFGRESGFTITGTAIACEQAQRSIIECSKKALVTITEEVPQRFARPFLKRNGTDNYRAIQENCGVNISWPPLTGNEEHVPISIKGSKFNCDNAKEMLNEFLKKWENDEDRRRSESQSQTKVVPQENVVKITTYVPREYISFIIGKGHKKIDALATKSGTRIKTPRQHDEEEGGDKIELEISGQRKNCLRAEGLIKSHIMACKENAIVKELGGHTRFVCFDGGKKCESFRLKINDNTPKLNGFIKGERYRIEDEDDDGDDDGDEDEISEKAILEIKTHLQTPLEKLCEIKDEKELMCDLWCHFGKVLVSSVDPEETGKSITSDYIKNRLEKVMSASTFRGNIEKDAFWKVSFEVGVVPSDVNEDALPLEGETRGFYNLKLIHTQWRYDYGFATPSDRNVRLKVWKGLPPPPPDSEYEPPVEVKNILKQVILREENGIKAWICYPSSSVLRGEIITPYSKYDCRMKLRAGIRYVKDKENYCVEEDNILSDYVSNCTFDEENQRLNINEDEIPEGFKFLFFREAEERMYEATMDEERFTVIVLEENGWDSDTSERRKQNQFGVRVVMNSWSEAMLSPDRRWKPEDILDKLKSYMEFLSCLKDDLFN